MSADFGLLLIKSIDTSAHLDFSPYTGKWFVASHLNTSDGALQRGVCEHRDTPELAVRAFLYALAAISLDEVIVGRVGDERRHYRWNGAAFVEEPVAWMRDRVHSDGAA